MVARGPISSIPDPERDDIDCLHLARRISYENDETIQIKFVKIPFYG